MPRARRPTADQWAKHFARTNQGQGVELVEYDGRIHTKGSAALDEAIAAGENKRRLVEINRATAALESSE